MYDMEKIPTSIIFSEEIIKVVDGFCESVTVS